MFVSFTKSFDNRGHDGLEVGRHICINFIEGFKRNLDGFDWAHGNGGGTSGLPVKKGQLTNDFVLVNTSKLDRASPFGLFDGDGSFLNEEKG